MARLHVVKDEKPFKKVIIIKIISIILAMLVSALFVFTLTGLNPIEVFAIFAKGTFGSSKRLISVLRDTAFLWLIAIGLAPAFKMQFWNNGAEGQILMGGLVSAAMMIYLGGKINNALLLLLMAAGSFAIGGLWGFIPAYFKVKYRTNETLFTLMMNYIAAQLVHFMVDIWDKKQSHVVGIINSANEAGWFPKLFGNQYTINFIIVIVFAVFMHVYMKYSKHGYEIDVVGESEKTAQYAGINVKKTVIRTVILSSGICALAGFMSAAGVSHTISASTGGGKGFTAIIVAWLGKFDMLAMGLISFMLSFLEKGAGQIASSFNFNEYASDIIVGIILFFIIGSEFFANYSIAVNRTKEEK